MLRRTSFALALTLIPAVALAQPTPPVAQGRPADPVPPTPPEPPTRPVPAPPPTAPEPPAEPVSPPPVTITPTTPFLPTPATPPAKDEKKKTPWYEKLSARGYAQVRFNRLYATEDDFKNDLGDRAIAKNNTFSIRRARLVVSGDVTPFLAIYTQLEAAGADAKMRDWYADVFVDREKQLRFRVGQSKVPYGWENMQSSQNRAPLDRSDPINSGVSGERDLGVFAYWETPEARKLFKHLVDSGLKGSGDYGMAALGVYQGQTLNTDDKNQNVHVVARFTYPLRAGKQILEVGANGYLGKFDVDKDMGIGGGVRLRDMRVGAHVVLYPQPVGFQAEYNVGKGPERVANDVLSEDLQGGYAMVLAKRGPFVPFARGAYYDGGVKTIKNAPHTVVKELAAGLEYQIHDRVEVVLEVDHAKRVVDDRSVWGTVVRTQAQFNY